MAWYDSTMDTGTQIFSWMEENPTAASFIGGAAMGVLNYYEGKEARDEARRMRAEEWERQDQYGGASTTTAGMTPPTLIGDQQSGKVTGGSITQGNIAGFSSAFK